MMMWGVYYTDKYGAIKLYCYCNTLEGAREHYAKLIRLSNVISVEIKEEIWEGF